jgi:hypothetical protein
MAGPYARAFVIAYPKNMTNDDSPGDDKQRLATD